MRFRSFYFSADYEIDRVIPILVTFCALFGRLIASLHDGEFCQEDILPGAVSKIMPFCLAEIGNDSCLITLVSTVGVTKFHSIRFA